MSTFNLEEVDRLLQSVESSLHGYDEETEEYTTCLKHYETLVRVKNEMLSHDHERTLQSEKLQAEERRIFMQASAENRITRKDVLLVAANLTGILLVLNYEHAHTLFSKAFGLVSKV